MDDIKDLIRIRKEKQQQMKAARGYSDKHYRKRIITGNDQCSICGYSEHQESLVVHHKDGNRRNGLPENLVILCANCHAYLHSKARQRAKINELNMEELYTDLIKEAEVKERN